MMMRAKFRRILLLTTLFGAAGCGSGGGGGGQQQPPSNRAPSITSPAAVSVAENNTGTIYTATATDPDGNAVTFSLSGGADRALFAITAAGALSFVQSPDFEAPTDADGNNVYLVQIAVSDGMTASVLDIAVTITNQGPDAFQIVRHSVGYAEPVQVLDYDIVAGIKLVVERGGRIKRLTADGATAPVVLDLSAGITTDGERGLLGAYYNNNSPGGGLYVFLSNLAGDIEIQRFTSQQLIFPNPGPGDVIMRIPHPVNNNHYGGFVAVRNGLLYVSTGDGGFSANAQNTNSLLGKILRVDISRDDFPADPLRDYGIPPTNPYAAGGGQLEIWVRGFRNPFRANFDNTTGDLWVGDVGQDSREEIDLIRPGDAGANFGWDIVEGTAPFAGQPNPSLTPPVAEYLHGAGARQGSSVTGGAVYRDLVEALNGHYVFADFINGNIWSIPVAQISLGTTMSSDRFVLHRTDFTPNQGAINNPVGIMRDVFGHLYIVDYDGEIFRLTPPA
jgi:glucose/arabinose dehydrogenase